MRVLIFHGYLLRGTGSNVYNASLAQALARLGHEVHLLCQDRRAAELDWVRSVGGEGEPGAVTVHHPDIGRVLPVYVADAYEGFEAKTFAELSDSELDRYLEANVSAVRSVIEGAGLPDAALANHLVMGPAILARAGLGTASGGPGFAIVIHGSALEYTVKPDMERFGPYAREGLDPASGILAGSRHTAESLWEAMDDPGLPARTRLGPPGVDTDLFSALPKADAVASAKALAADLERESQTHHPRPEASWGRDPATAADAVEWFATEDGPRVIFVGKLIVSKGIDLLLAAWPRVHSAHPDARLLVVGFGSYREMLQRLWMALTVGEMTSAGEIARRGRGLEGGPEGELTMLAQHFDRMDQSDLDAATAATGSVRFAGRLEHDEVGQLMPAADALVFPSTFPEAFGMVAAEAAAAGVLPVGAAHSGIAEVGRELAASLDPAVAPLVTFELGDGAIDAIAERLNAWLALDEATRANARAALRATVTRLWSWERVADEVISASAGRLDELPGVPADT